MKKYHIAFTVQAIDTANNNKVIYATQVIAGTQYFEFDPQYQTGPFTLSDTASGQVTFTLANGGI